MAPNATADTKKFVGLPLSVVGPVDIGRLIRELDRIGEKLHSQSLQAREPKLPKTTELMDQLVELNTINLLDKVQRTRLHEFLLVVKKRAPLIHMSFGADPSPAFTEKLMSWLRENIHPLTLLTVGLQPNIGAGCIVRTKNKYFDFSLGKHFSENSKLLMAKLRENNQT
jgi:hypothetical protein